MNNLLKSLPGYLYVFYAFLSFVLIALLFSFPVVILFTFKGKARNAAFKLMKAWVKTFSLFTRVKYRLFGAVDLPANEPFIITSNHSSFLDIPAITLLFPGHYYPLAKKELLKIPLMGWVIKMTCVIVDRSDAESRNRSLDALRELLAKGNSVLIYPEGHMNRSDNMLLPFRNGAFRLALETKTKILPVVIKNSARLMPPDRFSLKPGTIPVYFGQPIEITQHDSVESLKNYTQNKISQILSSDFDTKTY